MDGSNQTMLKTTSSRIINIGVLLFLLLTFVAAIFEYWRYSSHISELTERYGGIPFDQLLSDDAIISDRAYRSIVERGERRQWQKMRGLVRRVETERHRFAEGMVSLRFLLMDVLGKEQELDGADAAASS